MTSKKEKDAHLWDRDPDDWYVEPLWTSRALFAAESFDGVICDPCCGMGRILDMAREARYSTFGMDIVDRGASTFHRFKKADFFATKGTFDNIVCNPPYRYGESFLEAALRRSHRKTAVLLRAVWANSGKRSAWLETLPLKRVLMITPRPSMPPGAVILASGGRDPSGGLQDYAWFVFQKGYEGAPIFGWARRPAKVAMAKPVKNPSIVIASKKALARAS
jgi:hypothetical protein